MNHFDQPLSITLTVAQWLDVQCALSEAWDWNLRNEFPMCAANIIALKRKIAARSQAAIDAAADAVTVARAA
jgi:hypothetical protein